MIIIGIDPGSSTGFAVYNTGTSSFEVLHTFKGFYRACDCAMSWRDVVRQTATIQQGLFIVIEDARLATYNRNTRQASAQAQGAGDVKGQSREWERFAQYAEIPYLMVRPDKRLNHTAEDAKMFAATTKYQKRTSHHARVAGHLCLRQAQRFTLKKSIIR